jgi:5-carboxymethyl-2-hydroxymuconate isomerase
MPHLPLEHTNNLPAPVDFDALFARLHAALAEAGPFPLAAIKSRAVPLEVFRAGTGAPENVFVHLSVAILSGRDLEQRRRIGGLLLGILREAFAPAWDERPCDITVDVREMERGTYAKAANDRARAVPGNRPG